MSFSDRVREFHEKFEADIRDTPYLELFNNKKLLNLRMKLIKEEWEELQEAVVNKDIVEVLDAICDLHVVLSGFSVSCGFDEDKAFQLVHESNMSKLCDTEKQAQESVEWYKETRPEFVPAYRKTKDGSKWLIYDTLTGKVLKNKYYKAVDLKVLFPSLSNQN
jgi:predicted HAD superfamily Cof-like phosphohydrolase